jgi:hypothetical protein
LDDRVQSDSRRLAPAEARRIVAVGFDEHHVKPVDPGKHVKVVGLIFRVAGSVRVRTERGNKSARSRNVQSEASRELPGPEHATAHSISPPWRRQERPATPVRPLCWFFSGPDWTWIRQTGRAIGEFLTVPVIDKLYHGG